MKNALLLTLLLLPLGLGCGTSFSGDNWWDVPGDGSGSGDNSAPADDDDGEGDDDDDDDDGEGDDDDDDGEGGVEALIFGEGTLGGDSFSGLLEFAVVDWSGGGKEPTEQCLIVGSFSSDQSLSDCSSCSWAFQLTVSDVEVEIDQGCDGYSAERGLLENGMAIGFDGNETLYLDQGNGWQAVGFGETEGGEFFFEISLSEGGEDEEPEEEEGEEEDEE